MEIHSEAKVKRAEVSAVVIRKDGTVEDLGVIATQEGDNIAKPGVLRILKDAWIEGWHEGDRKEPKDGE